MAEKKSRGWLTIVYPDSASADWFERLSEHGLQAVVSPLHDRDVNATGEIKKAHYHVILLWEGPTTYSNAKTYVDLISGVGCLPMASLRGASRYLIHLDNKEKFQYSRDDVRTIGGLAYDDLISSTSDSLLVLYDVLDFIDENCEVSFRSLIRYCRYNRPDWAKVILTQFRENVIAYQRSLKWELDLNIKEDRNTAFFDKCVNEKACELLKIKGIADFHE